MLSDEGQVGGENERTAGIDRRIEDGGSDGMGWENEQYSSLCGGDGVARGCVLQKVNE